MSWTEPAPLCAGLILATTDRAQNRFGDLPLAFEPNVGQTDARVRFLARTSGMAVFFTDTEGRAGSSARRCSSGFTLSHGTPAGRGRMSLAGAHVPRALEGLDPLPQSRVSLRRLWLFGYHLYRDRECHEEAVPSRTPPKHMKSVWPASANSTPRAERVIGLPQCEC